MNGVSAARYRINLSVKAKVSRYSYDTAVCVLYCQKGVTRTRGGWYVENKRKSGDAQWRAPHTLTDGSWWRHTCSQEEGRGKNILQYYEYITSITYYLLLRVGKRRTYPSSVRHLFCAMIHTILSLNGWINMRRLVVFVQQPSHPPTYCVQHFLHIHSGFSFGAGSSTAVLCCTLNLSLQWS